MANVQKLTRRNLLRAAIPAGIGTLRLTAGTECGPYSCVSNVDFEEFAQDAYQTQYFSEWCWAACLSMVFAFYEHPVSQPRIVTEAYGAPVNMPADTGARIARLLNRVWKDDSDGDFRARLTGAYDAQAGVNTLNNAMLIAELDGNHPVIIGAGGHAMVLAAMEYVRTPAGPNVVRIGVFDPYPGRGARDLTPVEMVPAHLGGALVLVATARVIDA